MSVFILIVINISIAITIKALVISILFTMFLILVSSQTRSNSTFPHSDRYWSQCWQSKRSSTSSSCSSSFSFPANWPWPSPRLSQESRGGFGLQVRVDAGVSGGNAGIRRILQNKGAGALSASESAPATVFATQGWVTSAAKAAASATTGATEAAVAALRKVSTRIQKVKTKCTCSSL